MAPPAPRAPPYTDAAAARSRSFCLETGSTLVSLDRHFNHVDGLRMWLYEDSPSAEE